MVSYPFNPPGGSHRPPPGLQPAIIETSDCVSVYTHNCPHVAEFNQLSDTYRLLKPLQRTRYGEIKCILDVNQNCPYLEEAKKSFKSSLPISGLNRELF